MSCVDSEGGYSSTIWFSLENGKPRKALAPRGFLVWPEASAWGNSGQRWPYVVTGAEFRGGNVIARLLPFGKYPIDLDVPQYEIRTTSREGGCAMEISIQQATANATQRAMMACRAVT